jgi:hypothetical protein
MATISQLRNQCDVCRNIVDFGDSGVIITRSGGIFCSFGCIMDSEGEGWEDNQLRGHRAAQIIRRIFHVYDKTTAVMFYARSYARFYVGDYSNHSPHFIGGFVMDMERIFKFSDPLKAKIQAKVIHDLEFGIYPSLCEWFPMDPRCFDDVPY